MLRFIDGRHACVQYEKDLKSTIDQLNEMRGLVQSQFSLLEELIAN